VESERKMKKNKNDRTVRYLEDMIALSLFIELDFIVSLFYANIFYY